MRRAGAAPEEDHPVQVDDERGRTKLLEHLLLGRRARHLGALEQQRRVLQHARVARVLDDEDHRREEQLPTAARTPPPGQFGTPRQSAARAASEGSDFNGATPSTTAYSMPSAAVSATCTITSANSRLGKLVHACLKLST
eukprot:7380147-Prymnesium_polylepis.4